jgi:hypothetical protein
MRIDAYILGLIPGLDLAQEVVGSSRQLELEVQSKGSVDVLHEIEEGRNLVHNLYRRINIRVHTPKSPHT